MIIFSASSGVSWLVWKSRQQGLIDKMNRDPIPHSQHIYLSTTVTARTLTQNCQKVAEKNNKLQMLTSLHH